MTLLSLLLSLGSGTKNRLSRRARRSNEQRRRRPKLLNLETLETRQLLAASLTVLSGNPADNSAVTSATDPVLVAGTGDSWATNRLSGAYDGCYEYATSGGKGDTATFTFTGVTAGTYQLGMDWSAASNRPTAAQVTVTTPVSSAATQTVNETLAPGASSAPSFSVPQSYDTTHNPTGTGPFTFQVLPVSSANTFTTTSTGNVTVVVTEPATAQAGTYTNVDAIALNPTAAPPVGKTTPVITAGSIPASVAYGSTTLAILGTIASTGGAATPTGNVTVTIGTGTVPRTLETTTATIGTNGSFTATFPAITLNASSTAYSVSYAYAGDTNNNAATTITVPTAVTVTPESLIVTAATATKVYDGTTTTAVKPTITSGALVSGDTWSTALSENFSSANAGTGLTLTPTGVINDGNGGLNYAVAFIPVTTGSITKDIVQVVAATVTKTYDGTTTASATPTMTINGTAVASGATINGETVTASESFASRNAGTGLAITPTFTPSAGDTGNYSVSAISTSTGAISAYAITVTPVTASMTYNGATLASIPPSISPALPTAAVAAGDVANFTESYNTKNVGTGLTLTAAGSVTDGNGGANYKVTLASAIHTGTITAKPITVTLNTYTKVYDGTTTISALPTIPSGALASGDVSALTESYASKNVGSGLQIVLTPGTTINDGDGGADYTVSATPITTGVITQKAITVTASTATMTYNGATLSSVAPVVTPGLVGTDTSAFTESFASPAVGTNLTINASGSANDGNGGVNYKVTFLANTTGAITKATPTLTVSDPTSWYTGSPFTATALIHGVVSGVDSTPAASLASVTPTLTYYVGTGTGGTSLGSTAPTGVSTANSTYTVVAYYAGSANYAATSAMTTFTIEQAQATNTVVTSSGATTYGTGVTLTATVKPQATGSNPASGSVAFYVNGSALSGTVSEGTGSAANTWTITTGSQTLNAGSDNITASYTPAVGNGFAPSTSAAYAQVVNAKPLTASIVGTVTKVYNGNTAATLAAANFQISGTVGSDSFTVTQTVGAFNVKDTTAATVSATLASGNFTAVGSTLASNYTLPTTATGAASITAAPLTASIIGTVTKVYDGGTSATLAPANFQIGGLVGSESFTVTQTAGTYNSKDTNAATVSATLASGNFTVGAGTLASDYTLPASATGAASITAAPLTASIIGTVTKPYDGGTSATLASANIQIGGLVGSESFTVTQTTGTFNVKDTSATTVSASLASSNFTAGASTLASDYTLPTTATGAASITAAPLTVTIIGTPSKSFDGTNTASVPASDIQVTGTVQGESFTVNGPVSGTYGSGALGTSTVTVPLAWSNFTAGASTLASDYTLPTSATGPGAIVSGNEAAAVSITASSLAPVYGTVDAFVVTVTGAGATPTGQVKLYENDVTPLLLGTGTLDSSGSVTIDTTGLQAGTRQVTAQYLGDGNYAASPTPTVLAQSVIVAQAPLTITPDAETIVYGATLDSTTFGFKVSGLVNGDDTNPTTGAVTLQPTFSVGRYGTTYANGTVLNSSGVTGTYYGITCTNSGDTSGNYTLVSPSSKLWVNPAALSVVVNPAGMVQNSVAGSIPALTASVSGAVNGDQITATGVLGANTIADATDPTSAGTVPGTFEITANTGTISASKGNLANYFVTVTDNYLDITPVPAAKQTLNLATDAPAPSSTTTSYGIPVASVPGTVVITNSGTTGAFAGPGGASVTGVNDTNVQNNDCIVVSFSSGGFAASKAGVFPIVETIHAYDSLAGYVAGSKPDDTLLNQYTFSGATPAGASTGASVTVNKAILDLSASQGPAPHNGVQETYGSATLNADLLSGLSMTWSQNPNAATQPNALPFLDASRLVLTYTIQGLPAGATPQVTGGGHTAYIVNPGVVTNSVLANYEIDIVQGGTLQINPAPLQVTVNDATVSLGATSVASTTVSGVAGDKFTVNYSSPGLPATAVGYYPLRASIASLNGSNPADYTVTYVGTQAAGYSLLTVTSAAVGNDVVMAAGGINQFDLSDIAAASAQQHKTANDLALEALYS